MRESVTGGKLLTKILKRKATIGVVGVGYVGESVASAYARANFKTFGFDVNQIRVDFLNSLQSPNLFVSTNFSDVKDCDVICVCVPTPMKAKGKSNYKILLSVFEKLSKNLKAGQLIVLESSVAPGVCTKLLLPILKKSKMVLGRDFYFAHSPERIDPGNTKYTINNTPKVVGASDSESLKLTAALYGKICSKVVKVSTLEAAALVKNLENTFRLVNISLVNEVSHFAKKIGVDIWEVIAAASSKPYGFMPHYPGPGVGGDCIPVVPYHFYRAARESKTRLRVVEASLKVNELQPKRVVAKVKEVLEGKTNGTKPKVMLVGVSYKEEVADLRESPAMRIWDDLKNDGYDVLYHDPLVPRINGYASQEISRELLKDLDAIVVTTAHKNIPYKKLVSSGRPLIDTKNALSSFKKSHIIKL